MLRRFDSKPSSYGFGVSRLDVFTFCLTNFVSFQERKLPFTLDTNYEGTKEKLVGRSRAKGRKKRKRSAEKKSNACYVYGSGEARLKEAF